MSFASVYSCERLFYDSFIMTDNFGGKRSLNSLSDYFFYLSMIIMEVKKKIYIFIFNIMTIKSVII